MAKTKHPKAPKLDSEAVKAAALQLQLALQAAGFVALVALENGAMIRLEWGRGTITDGQRDALDAVKMLVDLILESGGNLLQEIDPRNGTRVSIQ
jgi:hypothetical protein